MPGDYADYKKVLKRYEGLNPQLKQDMEDAIREYAKNRPNVNSSEAMRDILNNTAVGSSWKAACGEYASQCGGVAVRKVLESDGWELEDQNASPKVYRSPFCI